MTTTPAMARFLEAAAKKLDTEWKGTQHNLGPRLYRALLAEQVLILAAGIDPSTNAEIVREIVEQGWSWAVDVAGY